jgi:hypothetical protein
MEVKIIITVVVLLAASIVFLLFSILLVISMNKDRRELVSRCNKLSYKLQELRKRTKFLES